jgi:hypothetical protein
MAKVPGERRIFTRLILAALAGAGTMTTGQTVAEKNRCTCGDGRGLESGMVSYNQGSDRDTITRIDSEMSSPGRRCKALWIGSTEIRAIGTPYEFHLERTPLKERRIYACGDLTDRFVSRTKTYKFVFDADSVSIREMRVIPLNERGMPGEDPQSISNSNLWNSIAVEGAAETDANRKRASQTDPTREFNRMSWILARREFKAHYVGLVKGGYRPETLVALRRTRKVRAGQLGQVEAVRAGRAIVRFYDGGRIEKFSRARNALRRWYDSVGGPYSQTRDDLYTPLRAYLLEVSLDDIVEINDYLDGKQTDRT